MMVEGLNGYGVSKQLKDDKMTRTISELKRHLLSDEIHRFREMRGERTVIKQRDSYYALSDYKPKLNGDGQKLCLNCGEVLGKRKRKYCSDKCSSEWFRKHYWSGMKDHILTVQNYVCQKCGATPPRHEGGMLNWTNDHSSLDYFDYVVDHKIPIALGGGEFDENNLQVLCGPCNKIKTKEDIKKIVKKRQETKLIRLENDFTVEGFSHVFQNIMFVPLDVFLLNGVGKPIKEDYAR